jgi:MFS family permease
MWADRYSVLVSAILGVASLGYAIVLPLVPFIAQQYGANELVIGAIFALYSLCQLVSSPLMGALSDTWGRKPLLLVSQVTTCVGFLILALSNGLGLIFLSRLVDGASAGNVSLIYTAVLDRYPREARTRVFGLLSTGTGLGLLAGPLMGGLLGVSGLALPAFVAAGLAGLTIALTVLLLPGSSRPVRGERTLDIRASFAMLGDAGIRRTLRVILVNTALYNAFVLGAAVFLQQRLGFGAREVGPTLTGLLLLGALFQLIVLPWLLTRLRNRTSAWIGFGLYIVGFSTLAFAADLVSVAAASALIVWGLVVLNPVLAGALANQAEGRDDGALMGLSQAVGSVGQIAGPLLGYAALYVMPGTGLAVLCLLMAMLGMFLLRRVEIYERSEVGSQKSEVTS